MMVPFVGSQSRYEYDQLELAPEGSTTRRLLSPACGLRFDHIDPARGNHLKIKYNKKGATGEVSLQTRIRFDIGQFYQVLDFSTK
jgi:hypothetical protein